MKAQDVITTIVLIVAIVGAIKFFFFPRVETRSDVRVFRQPDSTAYYIMALVADSLHGQLEEETIARAENEQEKEQWRQRALKAQRLADSVLHGVRDSVEDLVGHLDTTLTTPPDSAGRTYIDTVRARHSFLTDLWGLRIGYEPRRVFYTRVDSTITRTEEMIDWKWTGGIGVALAVLIIWLLRGTI